MKLQLIKTITFLFFIFFLSFSCVKKERSLTAVSTGSVSAVSSGASFSSSSAGLFPSSGSAESSSQSSSVALDQQTPFNETVNSNFLSSNMLPYLIDNQSGYADTEIFIAVVGLSGGQGVWVDCAASQLYNINESYNTISGPAHDTTGWSYADCFTSLNQINFQTFGIPEIEGCKMFISFKEPLYLHFFANGTYAQPNLENETDPSRGIRFETIELTWAVNGLWINSSRVDAYQYPMGVEVFGEDVGGVGGTYKRIGEILTHQEIISLWQQRVSTPFQSCYVTAYYDTSGIIKQPSKIPEFKSGGAYEDFFQTRINEVWNEYSSRQLKVDWGEMGIWQGEVQSSDVFYMERIAGPGTVGDSGTINGIPSTQEVIEAKGKLAEGTENDKNVQKHFAAAFNRHAIDLAIPSDTAQDWSDDSEYFQDDPHNEYVAFFHSYDVSYDSQTYAFAYDDVFEHSSTIQATYPEKIRITIGGFSGVDVP
ncbi:MAG TPA: glycoside hydrolase family 64 protein [Spirochaetota bacterium]|nr:glycoside hydrolase family 64 protein [Spirochaetota bacterium]